MSRQHIKRWLAVATVVSLAVRPLFAELPDAAPDVSVYSSVVNVMLAELAVTNFPAFEAELTNLVSATAALDDNLARFQARCKAALNSPPAGANVVPMHNALRGAKVSMYRRDAAVLTTHLLALNNLLEYDRLLATTVESLTAALDSSLQTVSGLDAAWNGLRRPGLPPYLAVTAEYPRQTAPGELVSLSVTIWNAGDETARDMTFRIVPAQETYSPPPRVVELGNLVSDAEYEHVLYLRIPSDETRADYTVTVGAANAMATAVSCRINVVTR